MNRETRARCAGCGQWNHCDVEVCPTCGTGRLHLKTARSGGAFIGCGNYPECRYTRPIAGDAESAASDGRVLGQDENGVEISLRAGRFGPYVQRGEASEANPKPDRASLPKGWTPDGLTLERALQLLSLPREVGKHPEDGVLVEAGIGRFGPFVKHGSEKSGVLICVRLLRAGPIAHLAACEKRCHHRAYTVGG